MLGNHSRHMTVAKRTCSLMSNASPGTPAIACSQQECMSYGQPSGCVGLAMAKVGICTAHTMHCVRHSWCPMIRGSGTRAAWLQFNTNLTSSFLSPTPHRVVSTCQIISLCRMCSFKVCFHSGCNLCPAWCVLHWQHQPLVTLHDSVS